MKRQHQSPPESERRRFLKDALVGGAAVFLGPTGIPGAARAEVSRAIGSGEQACRQAGNCLEVGEWDGAIGWNWGGKDRCDATDPRCGPDGRLRESGEIVGKAVPNPSGSAITHVATIQLDVGRDETGLLKIGLYGDDCPGSVAQFLDLLSPTGFTTLTSTENLMGTQTSPVSLASGGVVDAVTPSLLVDFGVPSQANAYGRSRGIARIPDSFVPLPKPSPKFVANDSVVRPHDVAGLVSVPGKGIGYGGSGFESDDEAFESSFLITADAAPALDKQNRRVIGQILDPASMAFLERLSSLPTKKGLKGVIPGQTTGPPLLKVVVRDVAVAEVTGAPSA